MTNEQEKFFEGLAEGADPEPPKYEFELARARANVVERPSAPPKKVAAKEELTVRGETEGWLTIDVYQTPEEIVVESAIAGVRPEDIDITVTPDSVSIKGERSHEQEVKNDEYLYQECYWGRFSRSIILPQEIDPDSATVTFKSGILTIRLPKLTLQKTRKLTVKGS